MEYDILSRVVEELAAVLTGARMDRVVQDKDANLLLLLHSRKWNGLTLLLAPDRSLTRLHLLSRKPPGVSAPSGFFLSLKKHLTGSRISGVTLVNKDRVVELSFQRLGSDHHLIFELLGNSANLILTDDSRKIVSVLRPVAPGERATRMLIPGIVYEPPEPMRGRSGRDYRHVLPATCADGPADLRVNRSVEDMFARELTAREETANRQSLAAVLKKALARAERRCEAVQRDIDAAEQGDLYRLWGELILANLSGLRRGQEQADLVDHDGMLQRIMLDPARSPAENAERYFRRYKKAKAGLAILRERLAGSREEAHALRSLQEDLGSAVNGESLLALRKVLTARGLFGRGAGAASARASAQQPYRTVAFDGWEILIGRSAAGNDYVTMHLARPDDLWLHAEGMPGSHVLVRNPKKRDIPSPLLARAASLAAYYSKGKSSSKVPVAYTFAKNVQKPRGAAPGTVLLRERKSIMAVPEPA